MGLQITITYEPVLRKNMWRVLHDIEIARRGVKPLWRPGMPEVHPLFPNHHSPFQRWAQEVSFAINTWFADRKDLWRKIYDFKFAWANNQGFRIPNDPRADFINGLNMDKELPRVEALLGGGMLIEGEDMGDYVIVKGLDFDTPVSLEYLRAHPEYWIRGVFVGNSGQVFRMLGDKYEGECFIHPLIINRDKGDLVIQKNKLQAWTSPQLPDPLKLYI